VYNGEVSLKMDESEVPDDQWVDQQAAHTVHLYTSISHGVQIFQKNKKTKDELVLSSS
jgi:hypothetical protein